MIMLSDQRKDYRQNVCCLNKELLLTVYKFRHGSNKSNNLNFQFYVILTSGVQRVIIRGESVLDKSARIETLKI